MKKNKKSLIQLVLVNIIFLITNLNIFGENIMTKKSLENTSIVSNRAEMDLDSNVFKFYGDVHLEGNDLDAVCDELEVISKKTDNQITNCGLDSFEKITAIGNVCINQTDRVIKAGHAILYSEEGKIVLTKSPEITNSQGTIRGHKITYYTNDHKVYIEGSPTGERPKIILPNFNIKKESEDKKHKKNQSKVLTKEK